MKSLIINIIFMLSLYLLKADDAVITAKTKTTAESVYEKAVADNTKEAEKAYQAYTKALEDANAKVLKALENAKADLNDTKKFTKLTITERATAIEELDAKIKAVKAGAVGEELVTKQAKDEDLINKKKGDATVTPKIINANFGLVAGNGKDVTDFIAEVQKSGGKVRIPHASWVDEQTKPNSKLFIKFIDKKGKERSLVYNTGDLASFDKDLN